MTLGPERPECICRNFSLPAEDPKVSFKFRGASVVSNYIQTHRLETGSFSKQHASLAISEALGARQLRRGSGEAGGEAANLFRDPVPHLGLCDAPERKPPKGVVLI